MKLTKSKLKQIIKEELDKIQQEGWGSGAPLRGVSADNPEQKKRQSPGDIVDQRRGRIKASMEKRAAKGDQKAIDWLADPLKNPPTYDKEFEKLPATSWQRGMDVGLSRRRG